MPYKIPKNRTTVKTIKMKNGILTGEADNQGNMYWFKDGKYITPYQMESYKYYDPSIKGYRKLGNRAKMYVSSGTVNFNDVYNPVYTPNLNRLYSEAARKSEEKYALEQEQAIPLQNQDWITLRTKGKMNLTDIPMNMLDSIAVNAGRSGTDFWTDMGLVGKESTFNGLSKALGRPYNHSMEPVSVHALTNNHAWYYSPEGDYVAAVNRMLYPDPFKETLTDAKKVEVENNVKYATEHGLIKGNTPQYSDYILADAFKRYQTNPAGYNPGQKSYVPMLNGIRQELQGEKQLQNYWNTRGKQEYARGQKEGMAYGGSLKGRTWDDLFMAERAEMMKAAIRNGIYNLDDIRSKYNEFAGGGPTDPPVDPLVAPLDTDLSLDPIVYEMPQEEEPVMKVSAKLADEVIATPKAFTPTDAKNDIRDFYVNDFAQRRLKYHPTETPTQVSNLFDNAHVEFGDIRSGVGGTYNSGNITISKRLSDNSKRSTIAHEMRHLMDDQLGGLTPEESQILHDAYNLKAGKGYQYLEDEYPTTNTELRYQISRDHNNVTGEDLNKIIQGLPDDNLIDRASWVNGYNQISDKILTPKNDKQRLEQKKKADAIRKALMEVAFNPAQTPFNYAAEGGSIHIKPSKKGTFTAAASRHGKSVQEFASHVLAHPENYSPAMRKKANFARNAAKWKHEFGGPLAELAAQSIYNNVYDDRNPYLFLSPLKLP